MTTINDISDLVRVLQERPEWLVAVRNLVVGEELLSVPRQLAQFIKATEENFRLVNEEFRQVNQRLEQTNEQLAQFIKATEENFRLVNEDFRLANRRFNRLEGAVGNLQGSDYERRSRTRILVRMEHNLGMNSPFIAMHQDGQIVPEINRLYNRGRQSDDVTPAELADLQEVDIIIADADSRYAVVEVSVTADHDDIERASRRAYTLAALSGSPVQAAVATAYMDEPQRSLASAQGVTVFIIPNRH